MTSAEGRPRLSMRDVERLLAQPGPEARIETATKIIGDYAAYKDDPAELALAKEIIARLAGDVEVTVRQSIAWQLAHGTFLEPELATRLARDVAGVAFPILRYAKLPEAVLVDVVAARDARKTLAVAGRKHLSVKVSEAIVDSNNLKAIAVLMGNTTARIAEATLARVMDSYGAIPAITTPMAHRPDLTAALVERLVAQVSVGVRNYLIEAHGLAPEVVASIVQRGREAATITLLQPMTKDIIKIEPFVRKLYEAKQLSASFLFRALCTGELTLFRVGLSVRSKLPMLAIDELLRDRGPLGLPALLRRCEVPLPLLPAFRAAISAWRESSFNGGDEGVATYQAHVLAAVFGECMSIDDAALDELLQDIIVQPAGQADAAIAEQGRLS